MSQSRSQAPHSLSLTSLLAPVPSSKKARRSGVMSAASSPKAPDASGFQDAAPSASMPSSWLLLLSVSSTTAASCRKKTVKSARLRRRSFSRREKRGITGRAASLAASASPNGPSGAAATAAAATASGAVPKEPGRGASPSSPSSPSPPERGAARLESKPKPSLARHVRCTAAPKVSAADSTSACSSAALPPRSMNTGATLLASTCQLAKPAWGWLANAK